MSGKGKSKSPLPPFFKGGNIPRCLSKRLSQGMTAQAALSFCPKTIQSTSNESAEGFPPLKKGGWGDLLLTPFGNFPPDRLNHSIGFAQHLPIVKTQYTQSQLPKIAITGAITCHSSCIEMLSPIKFDHQASCRRKKINDVTPNRFLPVELHPMQLLSADVESQPLLGIGHIAAEPARVGFEIAFVSKHHESKSLLPPLLKGGKSRFSRKKRTHEEPKGDQIAWLADFGLDEYYPPWKKGGRGDLL